VGFEHDDPLTEQQKKLSSAMIAYWSEFARTGSLNPKHLPPVPRHQPANQRVVAFNPNGPQVVGDMSTNHQCSFWT